MSFLHTFRSTLQRAGITSMRATLDALFPPRCVSCGADVTRLLSTSGTSLCGACHAALPRLGPACPRCALPTPLGETCGPCLRSPPPFDTTLAACRYAFPLDRLLQDFKYQRRLALATPLAQLLVDACRTREASHDTSPITESAQIIAMPLAAAKQAARGFNQAQEIARQVAHALHLPLRNDVLHRIKDTPQQASLPWEARHKNVRDAFACPTSLTGQSIILIDDVMTTGATASAAAQALRQAGAAHIALWVVARAVPHNHDTPSF